MTNLTQLKPDGLLNRLENGDLLISDGATGTWLQMNGLEPGGCPEEINESNGELIKRMSHEYFDAGSDLVLTNSFGGSKFMLKKYGYENKCTLLNQLAAAHASSQAPPGKFVAGSVGPSGEFLEPLGPVSESEMFDAFSEQVTALASGGANAIIVETMTAIEEAEIAIKSIKENTDLPAIATMTFDKGPRGYFTMMGIDPPTAAQKLTSSGADVVGSNCGNGIDNMLEIARLMRDSTSPPLLIHSNAGIPVIRQGQIIYPETPEYMAKKFAELIEMGGISIFGGCCGTTPKHVEHFSNTIGDFRERQMGEINV